MKTPETRPLYNINIYPNQPIGDAGYCESYSVPVCDAGYCESYSVLVCDAGYTPRRHDRYGGICAPCRRGYYKPAALNDRCRQCPRGTTTVAEGSTSVDDCGESRNNTFKKTIGYHIKME